jgi:peptidoglycan/LPS O-acetylase OafA/YrhL
MIVGAPLARICLWWLAPQKDLLQYMLLPCRMDSLALGGLIALRLRLGKWDISKAGLGAAIAVLFALSVAVFAAGGGVFNSPLERTLGYSLFAMTFAGVVLWIVLFRGSRATNWLNTGPMQFIGMISYGLYLYQTPARDLLAGLGRPPLSENWLDTLGGSIVLWIVLVAVATLSWYVIERPCLRMKDRLAPASR